MVNRVLYQAHQSQFISEVERNLVSQKMRHTAEQAGIHSAENEIASWENNAPHIARLLTQCGAKDSYVTFEFLVPFSRKRIDCMIYGTGEDNSENVIHIELKQWSNKTVGIADSDGNFMTDDEANRQPDDVIFNVEAFTGHANRIVAHPSQQVKGYQGYLSNFIEVFSNHEVSLTGLAYCYNYAKNANPSFLYDDKYATLLSQYPTYAKDQFDDLTEKLTGLLKKGEGLSIFNKVIDSPIRPSKKLLEEISTMIDNGDTSSFALIDDQLVARNMILDKIRKMVHAENGEFKKNVIIVKGGPGTGKTVIALHLMAELSKFTNDNHGLNVQYATKSKPLLEGVRYKIRADAKFMFHNVLNYIPNLVKPNSVDVLLVDEAHRIQKTPNHQYTKPENRTDLPQVDAIIQSAKVTVFFIDDKQAIRGVEIGSTNLIKEAAERFGAHVEECELKAQFRCNGCDEYMKWIDHILYNEPITSKFKLNDFDLRIYDNIQEMYNKLVEQNNMEGQDARLMAGFCWPWSTNVVDGDLVKDVQIGEFAMPWETSDRVPYAKLTKKYPKWFEWAYKPLGIEQVGCIYTAQGFEFSYAGVIIGPDLKYDKTTRKVITDKNACKDPVLRRNVREANMTFDDYVRNIYRVLMSRGMKGCFLYICDENLRNYMKQLLADMEG